MRWLLTSLLLLAACYKTPQPACAFRCGANGACPEDYACGADGQCHLLSGTTPMDCPELPLPPDAPVADIDAPAEEPDAPPIDAPVSTPDAPAPDAPATDAPTGG